MQRNLRKKSNLLFAQIVAIGSVIILLLGGLLYKIYNYAFSPIGELVINKAHAVCGCETFISDSHTALFGIITFVGGAILLTILIAIFRVILSLAKTRKFLKHRELVKSQVSPKLAQISHLIGIANRLEEIKSDQPIIFCHGLRQPKICVSSGVVNSLTFSELRAVLLHETQHLISREPARLLVIRFINTFRFIPGLKNLTKKYLSFSELAADELATDNFTEKNNLARAMRKILEMEEKTIIQKGLALANFSAVTEERVRALSEDRYQPSFAREIIKVCLSVLAAMGFFFYFGTEINAQTNHTKEFYKNSPCLQEQAIETCENGWTKCGGKVYHEEKANCAKAVKYFDALSK